MHPAPSIRSRFKPCGKASEGGIFELSSALMMEAWCLPYCPFAVLSPFRQTDRVREDNEGRGQLQLRFLRGGDRGPRRPDGGVKPGVRRGLSGVLPAERHSRRD